jgi:hypothetical protein
MGYQKNAEFFAFSNLLIWAQKKFRKKSLGKKLSEFRFSSDFALFTVFLLLTLF